jgi:hypothetical protein
MHCRATSPVLREFRHPAFATPDPASQGHHKGITGASPLHHAAKQRIAEFAVWALPRPTRFLTIHIFIYVVSVCRFSSALFAPSPACLALLFSLPVPSAAPVYHPAPPSSASVAQACHLPKKQIFGSNDADRCHLVTFASGNDSGAG